MFKNHLIDKAVCFVSHEANKKESKKNLTVTL